MPSQFIDQDSPRYQLTVEQLPRGLVKFPVQMVEHLEKEQARLGFRFSEDYARRSLERQTLSWYYDGLPVAYRPQPDGIEVLGVGWEETAKYLPSSPDTEVKLVQA